MAGRFTPFACLADYQSAIRQAASLRYDSAAAGVPCVAQIVNLPYRRLAVGEASAWPGVSPLSHASQPAKPPFRHAGSAGFADRDRHFA
jgi:hypothetical protein